MDTVTSGGTPRRRWRRRLESPGGGGMSCAGAWMARIAPMAQAAHFAGFHASRVVGRQLLEHEWTNCALMTDGVPSERCPTQRDQGLKEGQRVALTVKQ